MSAPLDLNHYIRLMCFYNSKHREVCGETDKRDVKTPQYKHNPQNGGKITFLDALL